MFRKNLPAPSQKPEVELPAHWSAAVDLLRNDRDNWQVKSDEEYKTLIHKVSKIQFNFSNCHNIRMYIPEAGWFGNMDYHKGGSLIGLLCETIREIIALRYLEDIQNAD